MDAQKQYVAIIGDIIQSRQLKNRKQAQVRLQKVLAKINSGPLKDKIQADFVITLGDEFQGLVTRAFPLRAFLEFYGAETADMFQTRFGIGLGGLSTPLKGKAVGMDGSSFHHARRAVDTAKAEKRYLYFMGFENNVALNSLFQLVQSIWEGRTAQQREIIQLFQQLGQQTAVAEKKNISRQAVSKILAAGKFGPYQDGWRGIQQLFSGRTVTQND